MATYRRRGKKWQVEIYHQGIRRAKTFNTKYECKIWAEQHKPRSKTDKTLGDAFTRYSREVSPQHKGCKWEQIRLRMFLRFPASQIPLRILDTPHLAQFRDQRLHDVSSGSVRRELGLIKAVLEQCRKEWKWIDDNPMVDVKLPPKPRSRDRIISDEEVNKMLDVLGYHGSIDTKSKQVAIVFLIALETAMRAGEILSLTPDQISGRVAHLEKTKNGDSRDVPLSPLATDLLKHLPFSLSPQSLDALFRKARKRAGLEGFTFHDSRATALTRLSKKLDVLELARMTGHRDPRSLMIYYREPASEIAKKLG